MNTRQRIRRKQNRRLREERGELGSLGFRFTLLLRWLSSFGFAVQPNVHRFSMLELAGFMAVPLCVIGIYNRGIGDDPYMVETPLGVLTLLISLFVSLFVSCGWLLCLIGYVVRGRRGFQIAFWCSWGIGCLLPIVGTIVLLVIAMTWQFFRGS